MLIFYGLATAGAAYQVRVFTAMTNRANNVGLIELVRANDQYSQADQIANLDRQIITGLWVAEAESAKRDVFEILIDNLSTEGLASIQRSTDLDDQYFEEIYAQADTLYENAFSAFHVSSDLSSIKGEYDLTVLLLAMGVAFTAWGSFIEQNNFVRYLFASISLLIFAAALWIGIGVMITPMPVEIEPLSALGALLM